MAYVIPSKKNRENGYFITPLNFINAEHTSAGTFIDKPRRLVSTLEVDLNAEPNEELNGILRDCNDPEIEGSFGDSYESCIAHLKALNSSHEGKLFVYSLEEL